MNAPMTGDFARVARPATWRPDRCGRVALVLQGGGALGAYQAGVYEALHQAGVEPDWVSGVSIGAINSALIAGNPPERRMERLRTFWERITSRKVWLYTPEGDVFRQARNATAAFFAQTFGQPGFFKPRKVNPWLALPGAKDAISYYETDELRETLEELVDFDLINSRYVRFSVGAVNVRTGNFLFFDNKTTRIGPAHIMASGALPPAFPAVRIGTDYFWDGGIVSNTPLQHLLDEEELPNSLVFQVDLFSSSGTIPRSIGDVAARQKDIQYSSRTRFTTDAYRRLNGWKKTTLRMLERLPDHELTDEDRHLRDELRRLPEITILQLIYQQRLYEGEAKDYEFSRTSMFDHWASGLEDTRRTLDRKDWLTIPPDGTGIVAHDVHRERDQF